MAYEISVIIPVYNAEAWLEQCVQSIRSSAGVHFGELDVILVDDGSVDGSGALCDQLAAAYDNVRTFHKANGGVASARNLGLDCANGAYIAWVDPDDLVDKEWYAAIREAIEREKPDIIVMDSVRFGAQNEVAERYGRAGGLVACELFQEDVFRDVRMLSGMPNKVMRAELFEGCRFDIGLRILEDYALMPRVLERARTVYYIPKLLYRYRQHEESLLHKSGGDLAFRSVEVALERGKAAPDRFKSAAATAAAIQAFRFCWNYWSCLQDGSSNEELRVCKRYLRDNLRTVMWDSELSAKFRLKILLMSVGVWELLIHAKNDCKRGRNNG